RSSPTRCEGSGGRRHVAQCGGQAFRGEHRQRGALGGALQGHGRDFPLLNWRGSPFPSHRGPSQLSAWSHSPSAGRDALGNPGATDRQLRRALLLVRDLALLRSPRRSPINLYHIRLALRQNVRASLFLGMRGLVRSFYKYAKEPECNGYEFAPRDPSQQAVQVRDLFPSYSGPNKTRQCILRRLITKDDPNFAAPDYEIKVWHDDAEPSDVLITRCLIRWEAKGPRSDKTAAVVYVGTLTPLRPVQTVVAGCALDSAAPAWRCFAGLMSGSETVVVGLKKRTDDGNPFTPAVD